ncbi:unnamed protein product, partial [Rotaria sp. Silwood2]
FNCNITSTTLSSNDISLFKLYDKRTIGQ